MKKIVTAIVALMLAVTAIVPMAGAETVGMTGGWQNNQQEATLIPEEVQQAFDKAMEGFVGSDIVPVAYLADQIVAGTNYCLLCKVTPVVPNAEAHYALVYIYAALDGTAQILSIQDIEYNAQL